MPPKLGYKANDVFRQNIVKKEDVDEISRWLKKVQLPDYSDEQIIQFLLSCNNVRETTQETIKSYVEITNGLDEVFSKRNVRRIDLQKHLNVGEICMLPERAPDGSIVLFNRLVDTNYRNYEMGPNLTLLTMTVESALYDYPAEGLISVVDIKGATWMHLTCLRLGLTRDYARYLQEALPVKLRKICFINATPLLDRAMAIIRPFVKEEVMSKIALYKTADMELFYKTCIPKRLFPVDYGGEKPCMQMLHKNQTEKLKNLSEYFAAEEEQRKTSRKN